jgi:hypothetical protein
MHVARLSLGIAITFGSVWAAALAFHLAPVPIPAPAEGALWWHFPWLLTVVLGGILIAIAGMVLIATSLPSDENAP